MKKDIIKIILLITIVPLFLIPFVYYSILVVSSIYRPIFGNIPEWLFKISFVDDITIQDFIGQYFVIVGIEVTGFLSYAIYKLSTVSLEKKEKEMQVKFIISLKEVLEEIEGNYNIYVGKGFPNGDKYNFYQYLEVYNELKQWGYNDRKFKLSKWNKENIELIYQRGGYFGVKIDNAYSKLKHINENKNILNLKKLQFIDFRDEIITLITDIRNYIGNVENNKYKLELERLDWEFDFIPSVNNVFGTRVLAAR